MMPVHPKAVIADDEAPLRAYLRAQLAEVWPDLAICAEAANGREAVAAVEAHKPNIAFLDIRMPGLNGMQVAEKIAASCRIVFVTAYDDYAVDAFEKEAVDYLLKPVVKERLQLTVTRLKAKLAENAMLPDQANKWLRHLIDQVAASSSPPFLQWLRVQHGDGVQLIAVPDVIYFQAGDKYTTVITASGESLIRKSIRDLAAELDPNCFCQIHRGTIVNLTHIDKVSRSLTGRGVIRLKERSETLTISRSYLHCFKQM